MRNYSIPSIRFILALTLAALLAASPAGQASAEQSPSPLMTVNAWNSLGSGLNGTVFAIAVDGTDIYAGGSFTDAGGDPNADYIAKWDGTSWSAVGTGLNFWVLTIAVNGSDIYVGGFFTDAGGDANADYIAKWDGASWSALGTGLTGSVHVVAVSGSNVYVGGIFTNAGGNANADYIARWNGNSWDSLGSTPLNSYVYTIAINGGEVYAGGDFLNAGGDASADRIAKWNGASWSALGSGLNQRVRAVVLHGGDVYTGGEFSNAGGNANADRIARWNGTSWSDVGGSLNSSVETIATNGTDIYVGGAFSDAGGNANADRIAKWNGTSWSALDTTPLNNIVYWIVINGADIYAGGEFTDAGGDPNADHIARFEIDASAPTIDSFSASSPSTSLDIPITAFAASDNVAVTGYKITESSAPPSAGDAGWSASAPTTYTVPGNGNYTLYPWAKDAVGNVSAVYGSPASVTVIKAWNALGSGLNGSVVAIATDGTDIYVGGNFTDAGGDSNADYIAKWDGASWSALGTGINGNVYTIVIHESDIYAGGEFTNAGGDPNADYVAKWDGDSWSALGTGLNAPVHVIAVSGSNVWVGGQFTDASGNPDADYIAKLDGDTWGAVGATPLNGTVYTAFASGGHIYAGGSFVDAGGDANADRIAYWNGASWSALGSGLSSEVYTVVLHGGDVYAGGDFTDAGGDVNADRIARWNGTSWSDVGGGLNNTVQTIAIDGTDIYVGGYFFNAGGNANADRIAKWDGTSWSALGTTPLNHGVNQIVINGTDLYAGGPFTDAGGDPNADRIARFEIDATAPTVTSFSAPSSATSLDIPITAFTASDNAAVTGYKITESSTPPAAGDVGWSASTPTTYTVAGNGNYTLYPWVKDAAGNVSAVYGSPASVTVDATAPTITSFSAPSSSTSLTVSITAFTASDNAAVTGYKITESSTPPSAGDAGWTASAPTTYTVAGDGNYTLYPWAKDAAGNVSAVYGSPVSASVDATAPTVTSFSVPSSSNSLNINITAFTASDNVAVTGYKITETSTAPDAGAAGWTDTAPTSYMVGAEGDYILYPWAKDAAGNVSALFGSPASVVVDVPSLCYVDDTASGANNGTSWTNAYLDLQSALGNSSCSEVWVAAGTYKPTAGTDRTVSFGLKSGVEVYGGFAGTETMLNQRDWETNLTVLSGDLNGNDVGFTNNSENSYHVVTGSGTDATAILDGFTIMSGNANSGSATGGGIFNNGGSPSLTNVTISGNSASSSGGGMYTINNHPTLTNVTITGNRALNGAGMYNGNSHPSLTNVTISGNSASNSGGGMVNDNSSPTLTNVTISGNSASNSGGGMYNANSSNPTFSNVTISGNSATQYGGGMINFGSNPTLTHVTLSGNSAGSGAGGIFNNNSSPTLANVILWGNGVEMTNASSAPALIHSIVAGGCPAGASCTDVINADPLIGPFQDNGGFTQTMALGAGSPAIDSANAADCPATDQRGVTRPQGSGCDIGAYEVEIPNSAPTNISLSSSAVNENQPAGTSVGVISTSDPDAGDSHTYAFCGGANDPSFSIAGNQLKTAAVFDYETKASYSVCIRSTDSGSLSTTKTFVIDVNDLVDTETFGDVSSGYWAWNFIERLYDAGITGGCSVNPLEYCPESTVTRAQMAVFLLKGIHGSSYNPPSVGASAGFGDVPTSHWAAAWIKQLAAEGITGGCGFGNYCPESPVTRAQMAVFLLRAKYGVSYNPPAVGGSTGFSDVQPNYWAAAWIKQLAAESITGGCGQGNYCPETAVNRAQMAVFLVKTFNLP